jgi:hypothetical protein
MVTQLSISCAPPQGRGSSIYSSSWDRGRGATEIGLADDSSTGERNSASPNSKPHPPRRRKGSDVGISSESMHADMLGLDRFSRAPKMFKVREKGPAERLLNPFGDPWLDRKRFNRFFSIMTSSLTGISSIRHPDVASVLDEYAGPSFPETQAYRHYSNLAASPYHYDETVCKLAPDLPAFVRMRANFEKLNLREKFIGYTVVNFDEQKLYPAGEELPEWAYLHNPESSQCRADRVRFKDASTLVASGDVFDIRKPEVCSLLAKALARTMTANNVDAVLVDYAVRAYAFGLPALLGQLSPEWLETFQENQLALFRVIHAELQSAGKELFLNGVMLDGIISTDPDLIRMFARHCDGFFWEQPFRYEWREFNHNGTDYYLRLGEFFQTIYAMKKKVIVKQGTYRFHDSEDIQQSWDWRFAYTDHGIERHLAKYLACFYLLYADRHRSILLYTYPVEAGDIFASEAYFRFWDTEFGEPTHGRMERATNIHIRAFQNGIVFVNNRLKAAKISNKLRPPGYEGRIPRIELEPLSGGFWAFPIKQSIIATRRLMRPRTRLAGLGRMLGIAQNSGSGTRQVAAASWRRTAGYGRGGAVWCMLGACLNHSSQTQPHPPSSAHGSIWPSLSSRRWPDALATTLWCLTPSMA